MNVTTLDMPKAEARKLAAAYVRSVRERQKTELDEVQTRLLEEDKALRDGYRAIAAGRQVIRLGDAIAGGGVDDRGLPLLAAIRADAEWCWVSRDQLGTLGFTPWNDTEWGSYRRTRHRIRIRGALPSCAQLGHETGWHHHDEWNGSYRALVPTVPAPLRPAHHLRNYVTLFEVPKWEKHVLPRPPGDPLLLKHLNGHLYAVVAQWDLTELEKAVLAGRA